MAHLAHLDRLRAICLALPEAEERETWGEPTMRVRGKIFAFPRETHLTVKAAPAERLSLLADERFFLPPYVGGKGWVGLRLEPEVEPDWDEVRELVVTSYRLIAPKRLAATLDQPPISTSTPSRTRAGITVAAALPPGLLSGPVRADADAQLARFCSQCVRSSGAHGRATW